MEHEPPSGSDAGLDRMVALLAEVSEQLAESRVVIADNARILDKLALAFETLAGTLRAIPEEAKVAAQAGARAGATELDARLRYAASEGAKTGASSVLAVEERLQRLLSDAKDRQQRLVTRLRLGLPLAFAGAVLTGLLLVHAAVRWGVPALPAAWEWPCHVVGADYVTADDAPPQAACAIWRGTVR